MILPRLQRADVNNEIGRLIAFGCRPDGIELHRPKLDECRGRLASELFPKLFQIAARFLRDADDNVKPRKGLGISPITGAVAGSRINRCQSESRCVMKNCGCSRSCPAKQIRKKASAR